MERMSWQWLILSLCLVYLHIPGSVTLNSVYDLAAVDIHGDLISLAKYRGTVSSSVLSQFRRARMLV